MLTDSSTASAGEAVTIAFRGRPHTRSFGTPTNGVPTANAVFTLSDGALLTVTNALEADRTGRTYTAAIPPDVRIEDDDGTLVRLRSFASAEKSAQQGMDVPSFESGAAMNWHLAAGAMYSPTSFGHGIFDD